MGTTCRPVSKFHGAFTPSITPDTHWLIRAQVPTLRESETSVASTKKLVGSASSRRALTAYDWDVTLTGERVVAKGILWKRKGLFWRERVFLLTSAPRLVYYDASKKTPERKGCVEWPADAPPKIRRRSPSRFDVCVAGRDYHLAAKGDGDRLLILGGASAGHSTQPLRSGTFLDAS